MFNFAWSEIVLIAVVALVLIGPKDLPVAIRAVAGVIKKMRRMATELQTHVDEMMREADMAGVRDVINDVRGIDMRRQAARILDPDRAVAKAFTNPFPPSPPPYPAPAAEIEVAPRHPGIAAAEPPAFIPPGAAAPAPIQPEPPAFIPPSHPGDPA